MLHARNSFLEVRPLKKGGAARSKSADTPPAPRSDAGMLQQALVDRLNDVVRNGLRPVPLAQAEDESGATPSLKQVLSCSCLTMMAALDSEDEWDSPQPLKELRTEPQREPQNEPQGADCPEPCRGASTIESLQHAQIPESQHLAQRFSQAQPQKRVPSCSSLTTMAAVASDVDSDSLQPHSEPFGEINCEPHNEPQGADSPESGRGASITESFQHGQVPKSQNLAERFSQAASEGPLTTLMIRNIPNRYSQRELIRELEHLGFAGSFDFFYAPIDTGTMGNVGYAFVNFLDPTWAERCCEVLNGYTFKKHQQKARRKIATVSVAHLQGLEANIRHYEKAAVNGRTRSRRCAPIILSGATPGIPAGAAALDD